MAATNQNTLPSKESLLTALRNLGRKPADSMEDMRCIAEAQASMLRQALPGPIHQLPDYLASIFPTVAVVHDVNLPVAGLAYWSGHRWQVHVRMTDQAEEHIFTVLHQLKRIIDHPLRRQMATFAEADWDALASYFAERVLHPRNVEAAP